MRKHNPTPVFCIVLSYVGFFMCLLLHCGVCPPSLKFLPQFPDALCYLCTADSESRLIHFTSYHHTRNGVTLETLADEMDVSVKSLLRWNVGTEKQEREVWQKMTDDETFLPSMDLSAWSPGQVTHMHPCMPGARTHTHTHECLCCPTLHCHIYTIYCILYHI